MLSIHKTLPFHSTQLQLRGMRSASLSEGTRWFFEFTAQRKLPGGRRCEMMAGICQCLALGPGEGRVVQIIGLLGNIRSTFERPGASWEGSGQANRWSISPVYFDPNNFADRGCEKEKQSQWFVFSYAKLLLGDFLPLGSHCFSKMQGNMGKHFILVFCSLFLSPFLKPCWGSDSLPPWLLNPRPLPAPGLPAQNEHGRRAESRGTGGRAWGHTTTLWHTHIHTHTHAYTHHWEAFFSNRLRTI